MIDAPERAVIVSPAPDLAAARQVLADEWRAKNPQTPAEIEQFYRETPNYQADLDFWHQTPERQAVTTMLCHVAKELDAHRIVDIGCGVGHDLLALREALPHVHLAGIEPNEGLAATVAQALHIPVYRSVQEDGIAAPDLFPITIESADLLICIDVLEHLPDPEAFLAGIATRARVGCVLFEMTATHDAGTPLHLVANRAWRPGRCLEQHGWQLVDERGRIHVWKRMAEAKIERTSLLLCAYRGVTAEALTCVMALTAGEGNPWRLRLKTGDALISRSRSIIVTAWWRETCDDVLLMVDDDISFLPSDADHITELCRNGHDLIAGAYATHNGSHIACRFLPGVSQIQIGPTQPPMEIIYASTGFLAIHRRVIDALVADMPLCHADQPWSFYPFFPTMVVENPAAGGYEMLSEDWAFVGMARRKGFRCWLDATVKLQHASTIQIGLDNMGAIHTALGG